MSEARSPNKGFTDLLKLIKDVSGTQGTPGAYTTIRRWFVPEMFGGDLLNPKDLVDAGFERKELNADYVKFMSSSENVGKTGEFIATKQQIDYISAAERAFRYRHSSPVRAIVHSSARRAGIKTSSVIDSIEKSVAGLFKAARDNPNQNTGG
jgi:hypothetical protein